MCEARHCAYAQALVAFKPGRLQACTCPIGVVDNIGGRPGHVHRKLPAIPLQCDHDPSGTMTAKCVATAGVQLTSRGVHRCLPTYVVSPLQRLIDSRYEV